MKPRSILIALCLVALFAVEVSACNRCGIFGRRCKFAVTHTVPAIVRQFLPTPIAIINNNVSFARQGTSVFGQGAGYGGSSYQAASYPYDPNMAANALARSLQYSSDLQSGLSSDLVEIAKINALEFGSVEKIRALAEVQRAVDGQAAASNLEQRVTISSGGAINVEVKGKDGTWQSRGANGQGVRQPQENAGIGDVPPAPRADDFGTLIAQKCIKCHAGGADSKGGLDLSNATQLDFATLRKILSRVTSHDSEKWMPRGPDGRPGARLTIEEMAPIFRRADAVFDRENP